MNKNLNKKSEMPRYQQIAIEIATRIVTGEYKEGQKIFARSSLASQHGVSAETARRAVCVLEDLDIVASVKGSGVTIKSYENAKKLVAHQEKRQSIDDIKNDLVDCINRQKNDMDYLYKTLSDLVLATEHFRSINPFVPFQIVIRQNCNFLNKTIADINFWQNTGATVVAIHRENKTMISPGPYIQLLEGDIVFFIIQDSKPDSVEQFLYEKI
jgi:K+/H+ antiporter YhaU regulatory subunit KhtT